MIECFMPLLNEMFNNLSFIHKEPVRICWLNRRPFRSRLLTFQIPKKNNFFRCATCYNCLNNLINLFLNRHKVSSSDPPKMIWFALSLEPYKHLLLHRFPLLFSEKSEIYQATRLRYQNRLIFQEIFLGGSEYSEYLPW